MPSLRERNDADVRDERIDMRATTSQKDLIREAAELVDESMSEFVLYSATQRAQDVLEAKRQTVLTERTFELLMKALDEPAPDNDRLRELFGRKQLIPSE